MSGLRARIILCAGLTGSDGIEAAAAALAVAAAAGEDRDEPGVLVLDLRPGARAPRGTLLATGAARELETACRRIEGLRAAARGRICRAAPGPVPANREDVADLLQRAAAPEVGAGLLVALAEPAALRPLLEITGAEGVLVGADRRSPRPLLALLAAELRAAGVPLKVWTAPIGLVQSRRALAGLEAGGESGGRAARFAAVLAGASATVRPPSFPVPEQPPRAGLRAEGAQALPAVLAVALLTVLAALAVVALGGAATAKGRFQRAADLAAISGARSMRDDFPRLFLPATLPGGAPNPAHLERAEYLRRARGAAREAARRNGIGAGLLEISFPDRVSFAPLRIGVRARGRIELGGGSRGGGPRAASTSVRARARIALPLGFTGAGSPPTMASGGGYSGPLAYRQGEPMRPDVAVAFDRMAAAARAAGVALTINSAYRSDAEQRRLWEQNPDPRMVARPGTSLHRCGTELDIGPSASYGWLAAHAGRFGFVQRYSWEAWHYGFTNGPEPCSAAAERLGVRTGDGRLSGTGGLPGFVPARYRRPLLAAASRHGVSAALLAAQLMAESNFNPNAVSSAGAQGIAQFMPATAAAYGLDDPFDAPAAIDAQARLMASLLGRFGSVSLALAAYNAGPAPVLDCDCVPPYPETQAYVTRIMGLLGGTALGIAPPGLEVRLVA